MSLSKKNKMLLVGGAAAAAMAPLLWWQNNGLTVTELTHTGKNIPSGFDSCRILHLSDLHNKQFGTNQSHLLELTRQANPDYIFMTGDLINDGREIGNGLSYMRQAVEIAPVYYTPGNHEKKSGRYHELAEKLMESGVHVLFNHTTLLRRGTDTVLLMGIADPRFMGFEYLDQDIYEKFAARLARLTAHSGGKYTMLLSHRPELLKTYAHNKIDFVFAGHAHGGQFRFPKIGGVAAAGQGFFPEYTSGFYEMNHTTMLVSRGLGNSIIKQRFLNRPELILLTLRRG